MRNEIENRRIGIIGAGISGCSLARMVRRFGGLPFVSDSGSPRRELLEGLEEAGVPFETGGHSSRLFESDRIVVGSGISPTAPPVLRARSEGIPLQGELDFLAPHLGGRIVGITGSNGKTTTTSLTHALISAFLPEARSAGNIGTPLADFAGADVPVLTVELSSFQLHWAHSFRCEVAVVTNLAPDHIDWHGSYEAYVGAKANLLRNQRPSDWAILQREDRSLLPMGPANILDFAWEPAAPTESRGIRLDEQNGRAFLRIADREIPLFRFEDFSPLGRHNLENAAMAASAAKLILGLDRDIREPLRAFRALPHRCEYVAETGGIRFVDDSKGTNVAATETALRSLPGRKVIILGGKGKGEAYDSLAENLHDRASAVVLIGEEGPKIRESLERVGFSPIQEAPSLEEAVERAFALARPGETVLLSPACTSWDWFRDYKERGDRFQAAVRALVDREESSAG